MAGARPSRAPPQVREPRRAVVQRDHAPPGPDHARQAQGLPPGSGTSIQHQPPLGRRHQFGDKLARLVLQLEGPPAIGLGPQELRRPLQQEPLARELRRAGGDPLLGQGLRKTFPVPPEEIGPQRDPGTPHQSFEAGLSLLPQDLPQPPRQPGGDRAQQLQPPRDILHPPHLHGNAPHALPVHPGNLGRGFPGREVPREHPARQEPHRPREHRDDAPRRSHLHRIFHHGLPGQPLVVESLDPLLLPGPQSLLPKHGPHPLHRRAPRSAGPPLLPERHHQTLQAAQPNHPPTPKQDTHAPPPPKGAPPPKGDTHAPPPLPPSKRDTHSLPPAGADRPTRPISLLHKLIQGRDYLSPPQVEKAPQLFLQSLSAFIR